MHIFFLMKRLRHKYNYSLFGVELLETRDAKIPFVNCGEVREKCSKNFTLTHKRNEMRENYFQSLNLTLSLL